MSTAIGYLFPIFLLFLAACDLKPKAGTEASLERYSYRRAYQSGEVFAYETTANVYVNQVWLKEEVGRTLHRAKGPMERVTWESLRLRNNTGVFNLDSEARKLAPYDWSLEENGKLDVPSTEHVPALNGVLGDLSLHYLSISPAIGIGRVNKVGETYVRPKFWQSQWEDRAGKRGERCFESFVELAAIGSERVAVRSGFVSPTKGCLAFKKEWMAPSVVSGIPNNFQEVVKEKDGTFSVRWGSEEWTVHSQIDRRNGRLSSGNLASSITLKSKKGCNGELEKCAPEETLRVDRSAQLALKP